MRCPVAPWKKISGIHLATRFLLAAGMLSANPPPLMAEAPLSLDVLLAVTALWQWAYFDRSEQGVVMAAATAAAGPVTEMALIHFGHLYSYSHPQFLGLIPHWIPWVYACGSPAVGVLARRVRASIRVRRAAADAKAAKALAEAAAQTLPPTAPTTAFTSAAAAAKTARATAAALAAQPTAAAAQAYAPAVSKPQQQQAARAQQEQAAPPKQPQQPAAYRVAAAPPPAAPARALGGSSSNSTSPTRSASSPAKPAAPATPANTPAPAATSAAAAAGAATPASPALDPGCEVAAAEAVERTGSVLAGGSRDFIATSFSAAAARQRSGAAASSSSSLASSAAIDDDDDDDDADASDGGGAGFSRVERFERRMEGIFDSGISKVESALEIGADGMEWAAKILGASPGERDAAMERSRSRLERLLQRLAERSSRRGGLTSRTAAAVEEWLQGRAAALGRLAAAGQAGAAAGGAGAAEAAGERAARVRGLRARLRDVALLLAAQRERAWGGEEGRSLPAERLKRKLLKQGALTAFSRARVPSVHAFCLGVFENYCRSLALTRRGAECSTDPRAELAQLRAELQSFGAELAQEQAAQRRARVAEAAAVAAAAAAQQQAQQQQQGVRAAAAVRREAAVGGSASDGGPGANPVAGIGRS